MWLRTVGRPSESHHTSTGAAPGQRAATAPGAPPQGLAEAQHKALPPPSPGGLVISPPRLRLKTCCHLCTCCLWRRAAWSRASFSGATGAKGGQAQ